MSEQTAANVALPLVSVVMPAYNHEAYVADSVRSVFGQTYSNLEVIVVDDGSKDATWEVLERLQAQYDRLKIYRKENGGVSSALNFGIQRSQGEYIALLASDDRFAPDKIERQLALFGRVAPNVALVHTGAFHAGPEGQLVDIRGEYTPAVGACFEDLLALKVRAVAPSVMFTRKVYDEVGGFDEKLIAEDLDFYAAIAARGYQLAYDPTPLLYKTVTGYNQGAKVDRNFPSHFTTLEKYKDRLSPERYRRIENDLYACMGRTAAGAGLLKVSWRAYRTLAGREGSPKPILRFGAQAFRHLFLSALPNPARHWLQTARARRAIRAAARPPAAILPKV